MRILFSPVGNTDPYASGRGAFPYSEGSMLHICRNYEPDKIYLYMSRDIADYEELDHRFTRALSMFYKSRNKSVDIQVTDNHFFVDYIGRTEGNKIEIVALENNALYDPQDFNFFYNEYEKIFGMMMEVVNEEDEILLNVSSGTPAMKSALIVLKNLKQYDNCYLIQVDSPSRHGRGGKTEYDFEEAYRVNQENRLEAERTENGSELRRGYLDNRCKEIECRDLGRIQMENVVKKLIDKYDYTAGLEIMRSGIFSKNKSRKCGNLLEMAYKRLTLDTDGAEEIANSNKIELFPECDHQDRLYMEYALALKVKIEQKQYIDFTRGITPLFVNLLQLILLDFYNIDLIEFTSEDRNRRMWDLEKIKNKNITLWNALQDSYDGQFRGSDISSDHLQIFIDASTNESNKESMKLKKLVNSIRSFEEQNRNKLAHRMELVKSEALRKTAEKTAKNLKQLFDYTHFTNYEWWESGKQWESYRVMNASIKTKIK